MIEVTSAEQFNTLLRNNPRVVVLFTATWCGPCKAITPTYERHSLEPQYSAVKFLAVDVDEVEEVAEAVGISAMPTFQTYLNRVKLMEFTGANPEALRRMLDDVASA